MNSRINFEPAGTVLLYSDSPVVKFDNTFHQRKSNSGTFDISGVDPSVERAER